MVAALLSTSPAEAQLASSSVGISARVVSFLSPGLSGTVTAAIIFDPGNPGSVAEASQIENALSGGMAAGGAKLMPKKVPVSSLGGMAGAKVAFITQGLSSHYGAIAGASRGVLTITGDKSCTAAGKCVVSITTAGKTDISVSKAARSASGLSFNSMFAMLAKEI